MTNPSSSSSSTTQSPSDEAPLYSHTEATTTNFFSHSSHSYAPVITDEDENQVVTETETPAPKLKPKSKAKAKAKALEATTQNTTDGVFANLGVVQSEAASTAPSTSNQQVEPPLYRDVFADQVAIAETGDRGALPNYADNAQITLGGIVAEDGEVLVDGLPVGDFFSFMANLFVSITFDFMGYMMTTMLATTHAARCGSRSGLGLTFIRYGFLVLEKDQEVEEATYKYDPENYEKVKERANADFVRAKRLQAVMIQAADNNNNA
ncbi:UNVERIFIED_CONTAM: hypothetical protein HDU68_009949 [Siphonaria sp. JEL0065]|nr:hypothetical protein HDU68_009947 [Siphonaria sp. JEL0065]KAJ3020847.1 hypothetical protein HDU68_009949 [Siphonaria sp. JEL0065]